MPNTTYLNIVYVTPFDPAYIDLWGTPLNNAIITFDAVTGRGYAGGSIAYPEASKNYGIVPYIRFPARVKYAAFWTDSGTCTANSKIGSVSIVGLDAVSVTTSETLTTATSGNSMVETNSLYLALSSLSDDVTLLYYAYWIDRIGAGTA